MEQKMAQGSGLTARQKQLLDLAVKDDYFLKTFYLSGGTALSSWYFHHRESYDLDFFSLAPFNYDTVVHFIRSNQKEIGYKYSHIDEDYGFLTIILGYPNDSLLKIDFNHYTQTKIEPGIRWHKLEIDSLIDITVNKIDTIATRPRTRDYVDLYFILKNRPQPLSTLVGLAAKKFREKIDMLTLSKNFAKASEYTDFPKMLVPFNQKAMEKFFLDLAKSLKGQIFRK